MRKIWLLLAIVTGIAASDCRAQVEETIETSSNSNIEFASETDDVWTPTLQLCWNELIDYVGGEKITYLNGNPPLADELNKQKFFKNDLNDKDYYTSVGQATIAHKNKIAEVIAEKFNESSDILDDFEWDEGPETNKWFIYSILKKDFPFVAEYNILEPDVFNRDETVKYKYFGYSPDENDDDVYNPGKYLNKEKMSELFYANDDDFALKIKDKDNKEEMILYLTSSEASFDEIYNEILRKAEKKGFYQNQREQKEIKNRREELKNELKKIENTNHELEKMFIEQELSSGDYEFEFKNYYKIPYLHIDEKFDLSEELGGIINGDKTIVKVLQTIQFDLDNVGARLKSEAGIYANKAIMMMSREIKINNYYYFDRPFVIFLKEADKDKPYFAARIKDGKYLVKSEDNNETERKEDTSAKPMSKDEIMALFN